MTTITQFPEPPSRGDPANFAARGDAFFSAFPRFVSETNAVAMEVNADKVAADASASNALLSANDAAGSEAAAAASQAAASASATSASASATTATQQAALASASVASGARPYATFAAANADLANIATNAIVDVVTDETRGGQRSLYQDSGTALVFLRAVERYVSPVPYVQSDSVQNMITKLLVLTGVIPQAKPIIAADFSDPNY